MPEEKTTPDYTGWKLADGCLCCPRCLARIVINEREPYITTILRVIDEHVCYAEAKVMYAAKSAAWRLPPFVLERRRWRSWRGEGRETSADTPGSGTHCRARRTCRLCHTETATRIATGTWCG